MQQKHDTLNGLNGAANGATVVATSLTRMEKILPKRPARIEQIEVPGPKDLADPLTNKEIEVLALLGEGKTTKEIGAVLNMSPKTAESHRTRIQKKLRPYLKTVTIPYLVHYAMAVGLVRNHFKRGKRVERNGTVPKPLTKQVYRVARRHRSEFDR